MATNAAGAGLAAAVAAPSTTTVGSQVEQYRDRRRSERNINKSCAFPSPSTLLLNLPVWLGCLLCYKLSVCKVGAAARRSTCFPSSRFLRNIPPSLSAADLLFEVETQANKHSPLHALAPLRQSRLDPSVELQQERRARWAVMF